MSFLCELFNHKDELVSVDHEIGGTTNTYECQRCGRYECFTHYELGEIEIHN